MPKNILHKYKTKTIQKAREQLDSKDEIFPAEKQGMGGRQSLTLEKLTIFIDGQLFY